MSRAWLSLGSNMYDRQAYLNMAVEALNAYPQIVVSKKSSIFRTAPWGNESQEEYLNAVVEIETSLAPLKLLTVCQLIENAAGRVRFSHWGPRTLDIDIIFYDNIQLQTDRLTIPHPHMHERLFVLAPLSEMITDNYSAATIKNMMNQCEGQQVEAIIGPTAW